MVSLSGEKARNINNGLDRSDSGLHVARCRCILGVIHSPHAASSRTRFSHFACVISFRRAPVSKSSIMALAAILFSSLSIEAIKRRSTSSTVRNRSRLTSGASFMLLPFRRADSFPYEACSRHNFPGGDYFQWQGTYTQGAVRYVAFTPAGAFSPVAVQRPKPRLRLLLGWHFQQCHPGYPADDRLGLQRGPTTTCGFRTSGRRSTGRT